MKSMIRAALAAAVIFLLPLKAGAEQLLIPVGRVVGLQLKSGSVTVAAFDDARGMGARKAGLRIGDEITRINGKTIACIEDVRMALEQSGETASVTVRRGREESTVAVKLHRQDGDSRLGVYLRQGIAGIGTVTWYDPDTGEFAALGHGVSDGKGKLIAMTEGQAFDASIGDVERGKAGKPGQLKGSADGNESCGILKRNTAQGVFGISRRGWTGEALPVAEYEEIQTGSAVIRSMVDDRGPREYSVEILKIYPEDRSDCRNLLIRVTDPALLKATGGIVQGMSGSPIIQDGKLVGAVTHVLVNDPTRGYGIFIENMLDAAR